MSQQGKNYRKQGGEEWVVGGTLTIEAGATVTGLAAVVEQTALADLGGTITGTVDGDLADVDDIDLTTDATDAANPTAAEIDAAVNAAVAQVNEQNKELQTTVNALLAKLRTAGVIAES